MTNTFPEAPNSMTGGCMCGAVRYKISEKPMAAALCHCNRCRPQSGSAFSTVIIIKRSTFELEGPTSVFEDIGASGKRVGRRCCAKCGSPLTTEPDVAPEIMFVKAGGIDTNEWFQPVMELFVTRRRLRYLAPSNSMAIHQSKESTMNPFQNLFDAQKAYFASNITRSYAWRVEQLDRMGRMIKENEAALQGAIAGDFKTARQEHIFETVATFLETEYQKRSHGEWVATHAPAR